MKMAVVTKGNDGKEPMADDDDRSERQREEREEREAERREEAREDAARGAAQGGGVGGGWFHLYKPGQGYWTRMGTAGGAVLLIALLARFIFISMSTRTKLDWQVVNGIEKQDFPTIKLIITGAFCAISAGFSWYYLNKPQVVDFFIATESEMKKVNWTSTKEIVGSTKVVIAFMFITAIFLFLVDLFFAWLFYLIKVLHKAPFT